jgi:hypothetical protein
MNATNRKQELMVVEIIGTREELETLADVLNDELIWDSVEADRDITPGFFSELYASLTIDAEDDE